MMAQIFPSQSRPFYNSSSIMGLTPINEQTYLEFANRHFEKNDKQISPDAFHYLYQNFEGITWYIQYVLNMLYSSIFSQRILTKNDTESTIRNILSQHKFVYQALLYQLTAKQKQVLIAIAHERKPSSLMSQEILHKYHLGASTVQGAVKTLLERDFITQDEGTFQLCDKFMEIYLNEE